MTKPYVDPQITFYARRNIEAYTDDEAARKLISLDGARRGIVFVLNADYSAIISTHYIDRSPSN